MPQAAVVARGLMDMVAALPAAKLDALYDSAFVCEAAFRSLPPLAKKYALQMLYVLAPVSAGAMEKWGLEEHAAKHKVAIDRLLQLRVFVEVRGKRQEVGYKMNQKFQATVQNCLVGGGGSLPRSPEPQNVTAGLPTLAELEAYALEQWEQSLLQLISSSKVKTGTSFSPSSSMMRTFLRDLLSSRDGGAPKLTGNGFRFLLMETNEQLWYIMCEYISSEEERGVDPAELILFLLELGFHTLGAAYSFSTLTDVQRIAIRELAELGFVKLHQGQKDSWFIPTKLASNLSAGLTDSSTSRDGFVVVESNFKMYAYSGSKLHSEVLGLFSKVEYGRPNLSAATIMKESIYGAFENGITAEQIISFLQQNAHPHVTNKIPAVPENVTDLIRLWETGRNRVASIPSYSYEDFRCKELFKKCCDHARDRGYLLREDSKKMRLVIREEFDPEMREFFRLQR